MSFFRGGVNHARPNWWGMTGQDFLTLAQQLVAALEDLGPTTRRRLPMKRFLVLCVAAWLVTGAVRAEAPESKPAPLTKELQEQLQQRNRLLHEVNRLLRNYEVDKGMDLAEKALAMTREVRGEQHSETLQLGQALAERYEQQANFPAAKKHRQQLLSTLTRLHGRDHWEVTDARLALEHVERLAQMAPADRRRLTQLEQLNDQMDQLYQQGKIREAFALAQKALEICKQVLGERHPDYAIGLINVAKLHWAQGEYAQAVPLYRQALEVRKQVLGQRHPAYARSLNNLATLYYAQGEYAEAEPLFRQAQDLRKQVLGERHPDYAETLSNLADLYHSQGKYAQAVPLYRQALQIRKQVLGERHPDYAASLNNLAALYREQGEYAKAEPLFRQALEIHKQVLGPRHPSYAASLNNLAALYREQGEYAKAEPLLRQARDLSKQVLGERHPEYSFSLNNLAALYQDQGDYAQAEPLYRQALDIIKQALGERHPHYATSLNNLATLYQAQGEYTQAETLFRQARDVIKQALGERHPLYASSLMNLAALYKLQEEYAKAEPLYRQARDLIKPVRGERHPSYSSSLNNLAELYHDLGEYAQAEPLYRQALDLDKQVLGERHPASATSLNNLAALYKDQGKYAQAEPLYRLALEIRKQVLGTCHPLYAASLNNLAGLYKDQGEYAQAESLYRQAIAAMRQRPDESPVEFKQLTAVDLRALPDTVSTLANYCALLEQRLGPRPTAEQLRVADEAFVLALALRERLRQEVLHQDASKLLHGTRALDLMPTRIGLCQRLFERESRATDLESALATAEQGSARVFLEQLGKARALTVGSVSPELRAEEAALRRQLHELDTRIAKEQDKPTDQRDADKVGQLLDQQKQVKAHRAALIRRMEQEHPQYAALQYPKPCSLAEARVCLAPSEVALLFVPGDKRSYLILVEGQPAPDDKGHGLAIYALPGHDDLADGVSRFTERDTFETQAKARAVARQAYALLLAPVKDRIRGKDLVIVPGGPLAYVPFEALLEDGRYLIEQHRLRYAPSLTALHLVRLWEKTRTKPQRPLWALADPVYDKKDKRVAGEKDLARATQDALAKYLASEKRGPAGGEAYPRLRFTGQEAAAIRARLEAADADVLTGLQATEAAVKAASERGLLARARYVHFATHGILGLDTGQPPALVLSLVGNDGKRDEEGGINDGFLRLDEVTRLHLNADLVVLSACETGKGRLYAGEGVTGLARAFLYAGSRGVVCSLWSVDDRETATFMAHLYGGLKDGKAAADALRAAKLAMIRANKAPVYWAPFILIGE
jgi:CHAT domain-containing protein/Tfp pilus assembly protein PilF